MFIINGFLSRRLGVYYTPKRIEGGVWIVPILSWHHQKFDSEPDITGWEGIPRVELCMTDYRACDWPAPLTQKDCSVAKFMDDMNEKALQDYATLCEDKATCQDWEQLCKEIFKCKVDRWIATK